MLSTVLHALSVLEFLAEKNESGISEISKSLGLAPSTTHRLISSLASREFLVQNPTTKKYKLGMKIFQIGSSVANRFGFRRIALINMEKLAVECNETVNLGILDNDKVIYLEKIREREYALDEGELIEGIRCIAVPVFNKNRAVVAAISIAGPSFRLTDSRIRELVPLVKKAAESTSKHLEYSFSNP